MGWHGVGWNGMSGMERKEARRKERKRKKEKKEEGKKNERRSKQGKKGTRRARHIFIHPNSRSPAPGRKILVVVAAVINEANMGSYFNKLYE